MGREEAHNVGKARRYHRGVYSQYVHTGYITQALYCYIACVAD